MRYATGVAIDLTRFEHGTPFAGDEQAALSALQDRLAQLQAAQIAHRKRALIVFEGWSGAGKKAALKRLAGAWDPCRVSTRCVGGGADGGDDDRHWLAPYWSALPPAGDTTIFYRSWYRRLIDDRASGLIEGKRWSRACDEINEFEAQQRDHGTLIVKLFFHVSAEHQLTRLRERQADPWRRHLVEDALPTRDQRERATDALHELFAQTDTRWAPWRVVDANDEAAAQVAALTILADAFDKAIPSDPPALGETVVDFPHQKSA